MSCVVSAFFGIILGVMVLVFVGYLVGRWLMRGNLW